MKKVVGCIDDDGPGGLAGYKIFKIENISADTEVFLYSIAIFFPLAFYEMKKWPTQESLIKSLDWFINKWKNL